MSTRKSYRSAVFVRAIVESKKGATLLVERVQLTPVGKAALRTTAESISQGADSTGSAELEMRRVRSTS